MKKKAIVIGGGFAGLSSAAYLARDGWDVTVLEKNEQDGWTTSPGSGGLVTAMGPVFRDRGGIWIGWLGIGASDQGAGENSRSIASTCTRGGRRQSIGA